MENFKEFFRVLGNVFEVPLQVEAIGTWEFQLFVEFVVGSHPRSGRILYPYEYFNYTCFSTPQNTRIPKLLQKNTVNF